MTEFITIDDPKKLPDGTRRCWTTIEEVDPDAETVYVYSPTGAYSYYYVPTVSSE